MSCRSPGFAAPSRRMCWNLRATLGAAPKTLRLHLSRVLATLHGLRSRNLEVFELPSVTIGNGFATRSARRRLLQNVNKGKST
jgi:hypothetical protein